MRLDFANLRHSQDYKLIGVEGTGFRESARGWITHDSSQCCVSLVA
ncbi:hypothetical protein PSAC2689_220008 [Paraburkholderia sacchari]